MKEHPITDYPFHWIPMLIVALLLMLTQAALLRGYAGINWLLAVADGIVTIGWFAILIYLAWFIVGFVSIIHTNLIVTIAGLVLWISGSYMACNMMERIIGFTYLPFLSTIPFRLLFGLPTWIAIILWYQLLVSKETISQDGDFIVSKKESANNGTQGECLDRITVKDGSRIHLIETEKLLYIQACGDYVTLVTPEGEFIKEQTMKYFETHLPADNFIRIHRSTIVNVMQLSRVELYGKETYRLILKNGIKLRVSLTGYKLLKEQLGL